MATVISVVSLIVAIAAFVRTTRADRRRLLHDLNTTYIAPESSAARGLLHQSFDKHGDSWPEHVTREERDRINSALAQLDTLGLFVVRGHVDPREAAVLWGNAMSMCWDRGKKFALKRRQDENWPKQWIYLQECAERFHGGGFRGWSARDRAWRMLRRLG